MATKIQTESERAAALHKHLGKIHDLLETMQQHQQTTNNRLMLIHEQLVINNAPRVWSISGEANARRATPEASGVTQSGNRYDNPKGVVITCGGGHRWTGVWHRFSLVPHFCPRCGSPAFSYSKTFSIP